MRYETLMMEGASDPEPVNPHGGSEFSTGKETPAHGAPGHSAASSGLWTQEEPWAGSAVPVATCKFFQKNRSTHRL